MLLNSDFRWTRDLFIKILSDISSAALMWCTYCSECHIRTTWIFVIPKIAVETPKQTSKTTWNTQSYDHWQHVHCGGLRIDTHMLLAIKSKALNHRKIKHNTFMVHEFHSSNWIISFLKITRSIKSKLFKNAIDVKQQSQLITILVCRKAKWWFRSYTCTHTHIHTHSHIHTCTQKSVIKS